LADAAGAGQMRRDQKGNDVKDNPLDFRGKVALVTGAASGMGLATARPSFWRTSKRTR